MSERPPTQPHVHVESISTYLKVFAALMVLLVLTFIAGKINLDRWANGLNLTVALAIAIIKALLVVLIFMHVKHNTKLTWLFASAAFAWLLIMMVLTLADYTTRAAWPGAGDSPSEANPRAPSFEHMNSRDDRNVTPP